MYIASRDLHTFCSKSIRSNRFHLHLWWWFRYLHVTCLVIGDYYSDENRCKQRCWRRQDEDSSEDEEGEEKDDGNDDEDEKIDEDGSGTIKTEVIKMSHRKMMVSMTTSVKMSARARPWCDFPWTYLHWVHSIL